MDTLRKLQAYCKSRAVCRGCKLAIELDDAHCSHVCALESTPEGWLLNWFNEEIRVIVGDADLCASDHN